MGVKKGTVWAKALVPDCEDSATLQRCGLDLFLVRFSSFFFFFFFLIKLN